MIGVLFEAHDKVRIGVIGIGNRGSSMTPSWAQVPGAEVAAVCDIRTDRANKAADSIEKRGLKRPRAYGGSERAVSAR